MKSRSRQGNAARASTALAGVSVAEVHTARVALNAHPDLLVQGARGAHGRSDFLLVRVVASNGVEGYGEVSATPTWSGEDGATAEHFVQELLAPALLGQSLAPVGALDGVLDSCLFGNPFTKAGVSTALWDAYARSLDVPLATALGGPYRSEIPIKLSLCGNAEHLTGVYRAATAMGFAAFKVKVGFEVDEDSRLVMPEGAP